MTVAFAKSQQLMLKLSYLRGGHAEAFLKLAFNHLNRWEEVVLQYTQLSVLDRYFSQSAPHLKKLTLEFGVGGPSPPLPLDSSTPMFGGDLPALEELRIRRWRSSDWTNIRFHQLKTLDVSDEIILSIDTLLGILQQSPELRVLRINGVMVVWDPSSPPSPSEVVLPDLLDFSLTEIYQHKAIHERRSDTNVETIHHILQVVQIPVCASFSVEINLPKSLDSSLEELLSSLPKPSVMYDRGQGQKSSKSQSSVARIIFKVGSFGFQVSKDHSSCPRYSVLLRNFPHDVGARWVRAELADAWGDVMKPNLHLNCQSRRWEAILSLQDLDTVTELKIKGPACSRNSAGESLLEKLASPVDSSVGPPSGPFLGLRTLCLSRCEIDGKEVLKMVRKRHSWMEDLYEEEGDCPKLRILLGPEMGAFSASIMRKIRGAPGVEEVVGPDVSQSTDDDWHFRSSGNESACFSSEGSQSDSDSDSDIESDSGDYED
ncbi:hypothetical protein FRB90_002217 [Tulasnella sp. 427]|nr:hypothetical protein FRB90_002217 [Tulasnella sp. 427]